MTLQGSQQRRRQLIAACSVIYAIASGATLVAQGGSAKTVARTVLPAVVTIQTFDGAGKGLKLGSGFIVSSNGLIVTNYHVIDGATSATVTVQSGEEYRVSGVADADVEKDFALLKIRAVELPVLRLGNSDRLEPGEVVFALGAPLGLSGSVTVGNFSQLRQEPGNEKVRHRMVQHSAAISQGSSGGPLVLETGEVVGVNTLGLTEGNSLFFALPINYVRAAIAENDGKLIQLGDLTKYVREVRAEAERRNVEEAIKSQFVVYRDPENLFSAMIPRNWQVQRNAWADSEGIYHVLVMAHSPNAQLAELNGWLSDGLRMHLTFPRKGLIWKSDASASWMAAGERDMIQGYATYKLLGQNRVDLGGLAAQRLEIGGTSPKLREPEVGVVYHAFHANGKAVVELAAPLSKVDDLKAIMIVFENSIQVGWVR
jgi:S1-C subfamily serine protease